MTSAIILKSASELGIMEEANQIVAQTLCMLKEHVTPGVTTLQLDQLAEKYARKQNAIPAFKGYRGFPGSLCVSLNEQVVHGIPSRKVVLKEGDILSIDFGVKYKGYYGDAAVTVPVGNIDKEAENLLQITRDSLYMAIEQVQIGNRISDISQAVQNYVEERGYSIVRQFVGHGIGQHLHEPPEIPNYRRAGRSPKLLAGMVLAIEPMVNAGAHEVKILGDGWTVVTNDKSLSAHFEHSVAVTENGPLILSHGL
ncbi:MAG: type I methionyl aminopeptidase [Proteobacteria bacterium]|nr:type I methionyl aminopeptidase [Pseudomonadota bacterium]MCG2746270.1 type I methionyl aminopeptidase [Desulfobulbaceae bacterium]